MNSSAPVRVLVVVATNARRGAEIEGTRLAGELASHGFATEVVALAPAAGGLLGIEVLGPQPLGHRTLRALRARARKAEAVIAYGSTTLPACAISLLGTRVPFIYRSIGDPGRWVRGFTHRARTGLLMHRAARVVALWDDAATSLRVLYRLPQTHVHVIANGRDTSEFQPADERTRLGSRERLKVGERMVIAVAGALAEEKRVDLAIAAVAELPDAHLVVAGDGPLRSDLEAQASIVLADRCTFTGSLDDVRDVLHAADVLLLTSRTEGMPGAVIEAALCGLPVVATDVGAMRWLTEQGVRAQLVPVDAGPATIAAALRAAPSPNTEPPSISAIDLATTTAAWADLLHDLIRDR